MKKSLMQDPALDSSEGTPIEPIKAAQDIKNRIANLLQPPKVIELNKKEPVRIWRRGEDVGLLDGAPKIHRQNIEP